METLPRFDDILEQVQAYMPSCDEDLLRRAYIFSAMAHQGQVRANGEPYLVHPLEVARILADMRLDEVAIAVGLLHDLLEDTYVTEESLAEQFGEQITGLVKALTKISSLEQSYAARQAAQAESFRRMLLASIEDIRVLLVKLADRLHNMRTLHFLEPNKRRRIAQETLEIYAPLAHRLGMGKIKAELEDLAFSHLYPEEAQKLSQEMAARREKAAAAIDAIRAELAALLAEYSIEGEVRFRIKHLYSIWRKLNAQGISLDQLFDFLAFRVIVGSVAHCYAVLGLVHQRWRPVPGRIKDYISVPKSNGYQSLHTSLLGPEGLPFEVQIRTRDMDEVAEKGVAAHWLYKEGRDPGADHHRLAWLRSLVEGQQESPREFLDSLKLNLYPEEVYCFTHRGELVRLPRGATPVDFAYAIHTEVGHTCVGARVNGRLVPLRTVLKTGDIVEIQTSPNQVPRRGWLDFVVTARARSKIRAFLNKAEKEPARQLGRKLLEREARRMGFGLKQGLDGLNLKEALAQHGFAREEDLFAAVGFGKLAPREVLAALVRERPEPILPSKVRPLPAGDSLAVEVRGDRDLLTFRARCCQPLPGDPIVGYITRGRGVAIHRRSCPNVRRLSLTPERKVEVHWSLTDGSYPMPFHVFFEDRPGMLAAISQAITNAGSNIRSCHLATEDRCGVVNLEVDVSGREQLDQVLSLVRRVPGVTRVGYGFTQAFRQVLRPRTTQAAGS
ncbi:MAG: bifunctional (p)ppGpp synthetase/guanosine-3',5'-bis(diphosphate) 3'-pyrophosphohydrolase [Thermoanaerobaculum sp.]|nr:bifunctional (p)ppGpp synthetase/guanosine-3',5'-bis(diphosphate) 3'-pyrophosphohydrolase [Thermoanaerobaculum sp.]